MRQTEELDKTRAPDRANGANRQAPARTHGANGQPDAVEGGNGRREAAAVDYREPADPARGPQPMPPRAPRAMAQQMMHRLPGSNLARLAGGGSAAAFEVIYRRHHREIYLYCHSLLGNEHDARDALQNTMLSAYRGLEGESREIVIRPWLFRIAHNESVSLLRSRNGDVQLDPAETLSAESEGDFEAREEIRSLLSDLELLSPRQRSALLMRELSGLRFREIGAALDTSPAGAKQAVYQARIALTDLEQGRDMSCDEVRFKISANDRRRLRGRRVRAHLRGCVDCQAFEAELETRRSRLAAIGPPLAAPMSLAVIRDLLPGAGVGGLSSGGVGGVVGGAVALKAGAATLAIGAAVYAGGEVPGTTGAWATEGVPASIARFAELAPSAGAGAADEARARRAGNEDSHPAAGSERVGSASPDWGHAGSGSGWSPASAPVRQAQATGPSNAATAAGQTVATPDQTAAAPGQGGSPPDQTAAAPGQGGSPPDQTATAPGQGGSLPDQTAAAPGQGGSLPDQTRAAPGQGRTASDQTATAPGQGGSLPDQTDAAPGQGGSLPDQAGTAPGQGGRAPGESGTAPDQSSATPGESGTADQSSAIPGESGTADQSSATPGESGNGSQPPANG